MRSAATIVPPLMTVDMFALLVLRSGCRAVRRPMFPTSGYTVLERRGLAKHGDAAALMPHYIETIGPAPARRQRGGGADNPRSGNDGCAGTMRALADAPTGGQSPTAANFVFVRDCRPQGWTGPTGMAICAPIAAMAAQGCVAQLVEQLTLISGSQVRSLSHPPKQLRENKKLSENCRARNPRSRSPDWRPFVVAGTALSQNGTSFVTPNISF